MPSRITPVPEVFERFFEFELSASGDAQAPVTKEAEPGRIRQTDEYIVAPAIAGATG